MATESYRWECVTPCAAFAPRDGAGAIVYDGRMWLIGGWNPLEKDRVFFPRTCNNEVWNSADGKNWELMKGGTFGTDAYDPERDWEGRHYAGYGVHDGNMWIVGGDANQKHYQGDVWTSGDGVNWQWVNKDVTPPFMPRAFWHTVMFDGAIWVMGGQTMPGFVADVPEAFFNDVWRSGDGVHWEKIPTVGAMWAPRGFIGGAAVHRGRMWVMGGGTYDTPTTPERKFFNDVWSSADGVHWTCHVQHAPWKPRSMHEVAVWDDALWVMEGTQPGNSADVWYSSDGEHWTELPGTPWKPRHAASVFVHDDALWMVAGNNMESDVWKLVRQ